MTSATIILWIIALGLVVYAWWRKDGSLRKGVLGGWQTFRGTALLLLAAFAIVGYVNVLSPEQLVQAWIGPDSGWKGLVLAEGVGMVLPGGPYVVLPLIGLLYQAGAGLGPAVTLITSWSTLAFLSVTFELPFMGWRFTAIRWGLGLVFPLLAGVLATVLLGS